MSYIDIIRLLLSYDYYIEWHKKATERSHVPSTLSLSVPRIFSKTVRLTYGYSSQFQFLRCFTIMKYGNRCL